MVVTNYHTCFSFADPFGQHLDSCFHSPVVCSLLTECRVGCPPEHLHSSGAGASGERSRSALPRGGGVGQSAATGAGWSATRRTVPHSSKCLKVSASE